MGGFTSPGAGERAALLQAAGASCFEDLIQGIPETLREASPLRLPGALSECEALRFLRSLSNQNGSDDAWNTFLGGGVRSHYVPAATQALLSRSEFLTAYTPYQAEVSQGTLQSIYEFQSLICEITGMEASNASLYDGATALAEAMMMARAVHRQGSAFIIPASLNPFYREVLRTYARGPKIELVEAPCAASGALDCKALALLLKDNVFGVAVQSPNYFGVVEDIAAVAELKKQRPFVLVVSPDLLSLALLMAPGKAGADICAGEAHYFASGPSFGGPLLGFLSTHKSRLRQMPGRIVGRTLDKDGKRGFVLTAQTREQHIRREKATSNICSNEGLLALGATITLSLLGKEGFRDMARLNVEKTQYALSRFRELKNVSLPFSGPVFNEFVVELKGGSPDALFKKAAEKSMVPGFRMDRADPAQKNRLLVCVTERKSKADIDQLVEVFGK